VSTLALAVATGAASAPDSPTVVGKIAFAVHHGDGDAPWDIYVVRTDGRWVVKKPTKGLDENDPVWSPDGRHIAFEGRTIPGGTDMSIYTMNPDGTHRRRLARGYDPQWSPDGRRIAYDKDGIYVYIVNARGGGERRLTRTGDSYVGMWAPRRTIVVLGGPTRIYVINPDGTGLRRVTRTGHGTLSVGGWSPDGKLLLYAVETHGISTWRLSDGAVRRLTRGPGDGDPIWSPGGREIAFTRNTAATRENGVWVMKRDGTGARRIAAAAKAHPWWWNEYHTPTWTPG
jgi:Tol biopolymer transport system component